MDCFFFLLADFGGATEVSHEAAVELGFAFFFAGELDGEVLEVRSMELESARILGLLILLTRSVMSEFGT